jgi:hypothetical protein
MKKERKKEERGKEKGVVVGRRGRRGEREKGEDDLTLLSQSIDIEHVVLLYSEFE